MKNKKIFMKIMIIAICCSCYIFANDDAISVPSNNKLVNAKSKVSIENKDNKKIDVVSDVGCIAESEPCVVIKNTSLKVINAINNQKSLKAIIKIIDGDVSDKFDFNLMTTYAIGQNWKLATKPEQEQIINNFRKLLIYTYSAALSKFKGAKVKIINENIVSNKATVLTQTILPDSSNINDDLIIKIEYYLIKNTPTSSWKIYDIKIENNSLITTYRTQFNEIIQKEKISGLLKKLQEKNTSMQNKIN